MISVFPSLAEQQVYTDVFIQRIPAIYIAEQGVTPGGPALTTENFRYLESSDRNKVFLVTTGAQALLASPEGQEKAFTLWSKRQETIDSPSQQEKEALQWFNRVFARNITPESITDTDRANELANKISPLSTQMLFSNTKDVNQKMKDLTSVTVPECRGDIAAKQSKQAEEQKVEEKKSPAIDFKAVQRCHGMDCPETQIGDFNPYALVADVRGRKGTFAQRTAQSKDFLAQRTAKIEAEKAAQQEAAIKLLTRDKKVDFSGFNK